MELFTNTIYFFRKLNSINLFFSFSNKRINNKIKNLVVVVLVETVESLNKVAYHPSLSTQKHVKKFYFLLNSFIFI